MSNLHKIKGNEHSCIQIDFQDLEELMHRSNDVKSHIPESLDEQLTTLQIDNERLMQEKDVSFVFDGINFPELQNFDVVTKGRNILS